MKIEHNKIIAHYGEHISVLYPVSGTILSGYASVTMKLRGKAKFEKEYSLEVDEYDNTLRINIEEELAPGRYYYEIVGINNRGSRITFTDHPMYIEVLPAL